MKGPRLQTTAIFSLIAHMTFIFAALIIMRQTNKFVVPPSYIVRLVSIESEESAAAADDTITKAPEPSPPSKKTSPVADDAGQYASDRIAAIKAKRKLKEIVNLRNIISVKGFDSAVGDAAEDFQPAESGAKEYALSNYFDKIVREIRQQWAYPEAWGKNLEAIVLVSIMRDGTVKINRIEKSSGNLLFDGSVVKAIIKASPVTPPPYEMEQSLRFTP